MARTLVVTGASAGIGRAAAERFLAEDWNVALLARRQEPLAEVAAGRLEALPIVCDVTDPAGVEAAFDAVMRRFGRIDALFNNAGISRPAGLIDEIPLADWFETVAVNLNGMFLSARAAFARMRAQDPQGGRIINNGSISAQVPRYGSVAYTMSKHAVTGLTRSLSLDGRAFDIACGQIDIGNALTDMAEKMTRGVPQADGQLQIEPVMPASEVARAVWHMATLPKGTNVQFMTVMATAMPYIGRG